MEMATPNRNGLQLLQQSNEQDVVIGNTSFQKDDEGTWQHPQSMHKHLIDYIIVHRRHF